MITPLKKILLLFLVNALVLSSCAGGLSTNRGSSGSIPVKGGLSSYVKFEIPKEIVETGSGFFLVEVDDEALEESPEIKDATVEAEVVEDEGAERVVGQAIASAEGVSAFFDPVVETTVPVQVVNEQGEPVPGAILEYLALDGVVIIKAIDPEGNLAEGVAVFEYDQLAGGEESSSLLAPLKELLFPRPVYAKSLASPSLSFTASVIIVLGLKIYSSLVLLSEGKAIVTNPLQFQETAVGQDQFWCETPERIAAKESVTTGVFLSFLTGPLKHGDDAVEVIVHAGEVTANEVQSALDAESDQEPILVRRYEHSSDQITLTNSSGGLITSSSVYKTYETVGSCAEIPELEGMDWITAQSILEEEGILWEVSYQISGEVQDLPSDTPGMVMTQSPPPIRENGNNTLIPLGDWPELDNTMQITVIPIPPLPAEERPTSPTCEDYFGENYLLWDFGEKGLRCGFSYNCETEKLPGGMESTCTSAAPDLVLDSAFEFTKEDCQCAFYAPPGEYEDYPRKLAYWNGSVTIHGIVDSIEETWTCAKVAHQDWHFSWIDSYLYYSDEDGDGLPDFSLQLNEVIENCGSIDRSLFVMDEFFK